MFWWGFDLERHTEACSVHCPGVLTRELQITSPFPTNYQMIHCNSKRKNNGASCLINQRMPHHNGLLIQTSASTDWLPTKPLRIMVHGSEHFNVMTQTHHLSWCIFWQWRRIECTLCARRDTTSLSLSPVLFPRLGWLYGNAIIQCSGMITLAEQ